MAKQGMKRPENTHTQCRNAVSHVPEIQQNIKKRKQIRLSQEQNRLLRKYGIQNHFLLKNRFRRSMQKLTMTLQGIISKMI